MANQLTVKQFGESLANNRGELAKTLPEHVSIERFERVTLTAVQRDSTLLQTTPQSLFDAVKSCANDGLIPDGREAALTNFGNKAAYMPMVYGLVKLAHESDELSHITSRVVHDADEFDFYTDENGEHLHHRPSYSDDVGNRVAVYAMARTKDGEAYIEVMRRSEVEAVQKASKSANSGPWKEFPEEMWKKTAIRRLWKRLPRGNSRLESAVGRMDELYDYGQRERDTGAAPSASQSVEVLSNEPTQEPEPEPEQPAASGEPDNGV